MKKLLMEIIEDCNDKNDGCPYCTDVQFAGYMCAHPDTDRAEEGRYTPSTGIPKWCPLKAEIKKLDIKDGDTLVIRFNDPIPIKNFIEYRDMLQKEFPNNKIAILCGKTSMKVEKEEKHNGMV